MDKETKRLFGALALAAAGFFVPLYFGKIWLALGMALAVAFLFLGSLLKQSKKDFESKWTWRVVAGLAVLIMLFNAISFVHDYGMKDYQKGLLLEIRKTIDSGITQADVREKFLYVLGQYHQNDRESIVATYRDLMSEHLGENGIYLSDQDLRIEKDSSNADDNINHFYEIDEDADEVKIIAVTDISLGSDQEYENYDGQIGRFEMEFTLNKEGVSYEVLN